jgi:hypothetical protein
MGLLNRLAPRRAEYGASNGASANDLAFGTKALQKFLSSLTSRESPVLLDLGPVVGSNLSFFGEQLGCKIRVEDIFADIDRHVSEGRIEALPDFLAKRLSQADGVVDGILCWDVIDYLDRPSAQALAKELTRVLRPDGALLAFFGTVPPVDSRYTKFVIVDEMTLRYRPYAAARGRQAVLVNRDIIRLFPGMRVSDSFLLQNNVREIVFRKSPSAS